MELNGVPKTQELISHPNTRFFEKGEIWKHLR